MSRKELLQLLEEKNIEQDSGKCSHYYYSNLTDEICQIRAELVHRHWEKKGANRAIA
jgi:hypothetical protein